MGCATEHMFCFSCNLRRLVRAAFILSLLPLLAACGGGASDTALPFPPAGPDSAPDPMSFGPFPVGAITLEMEDPSREDPETGGPRSFKLEIWYPAVQGTRDLSPWTYETWTDASEEYLGEDYQKLVDAALPGMQSEAVRDADMDTAHAPYPLVLFSHGSYGIRWQSVFYTVHLASHGYVVAAPDHKGNTVWELLRDGYDEGTTMVSSQQRLFDIDFVLDELKERNADHADFLFGAIDEDNIAASGHSFGGWTAFTAACNNPHILASVSQSPILGLAEIYGCVLAEYPVPAMVMGGTLDNTVPFKDQYCDYRAVTAPEMYLYQIEGGGHYTFSDICDLDLAALAKDFDFGPAEEALQDGCSQTENVPWHEAHKSINHYSTAFLNLHLRASPGCVDYLVEFSAAPFDAVTFHAGTVPDWPAGGCPAGK